MTPYPATLGVILAGGLARRMGGGDKPLLMLQGQTLLGHVKQRLAPQCGCVILNANGEPSRFIATGLPVVADSVPDHPGPLAGILTALEWTARNQPAIEWVVSVPGDTPFIPADLVERLHAARSTAQSAVAYAASGPQEHYTTGLWPVALRHDLRHALTVKGMRRVEDWAKAQGAATATWPIEPFDPFFNINTPEELDAASTMLSITSLLSRRFGNDGCGEQEDCDD
ncbi:molybdopterin-guanine dinucleotide biosynthesis protein A [Microvirga vignae]|uniref:Molybdenum cofactor guanylyltransferase n=1 Tax=Microvirga vignae TaxID=1225564 RepID=A0A0H1RDU2_9HYPH|nr:molybdenum cofactor guanylyltransferase MobA [Microvirga vignae]KLK93274.1 molybdopterin-guanine dinucleotide biosynthesis protein A [Microvirga vignae]